MKYLICSILLVSLACTSSVVAQPTQSATRATSAPAPTAIEAAFEVFPTPMTVGNVVAAEAVHVRSDHGLNAEGVGYLFSNDLVLEMDCFTEDGITWVKHETGWSVVRNKTAEYIAGVCGG